MKKKTPAYEQLRLIMQDLRMTAQDIAEFDDDIATNMATQITAAESWIDEIEKGYKDGARKSSGPRVKSAKRKAAAIANLKKASKTLTKDQRRERAKKAALARWKRETK